MIFLYIRGEQLSMSGRKKILRSLDKILNMLEEETSVRGPAPQGGPGYPHNDNGLQASQGRGCGHCGHCRPCKHCRHCPHCSHCHHAQALPGVPALPEEPASLGGPAPEGGLSPGGPEQGVHGSMGAAVTTESKDILAQAACTGRQTEGGWMYAVRRDCIGEPTLTCNEICQDETLRIQDLQLVDANARGQCASSMYVYDNVYPTTFNRLGLKTGDEILGITCDGTHCGPNYCCCLFSV